MRKSILCLILATLTVFFASCSNKSSDNVADKKVMKLYEVSQAAIEVNVNDIHEKSNGEVYADVTVSIPNYTEIFMNCTNADDIVAAVSSALTSSECPNLEYDITVPVTYDEKGDQIIHTDEELKKILEIQLIKALNAVYEEIGE